MILSKRLTHIFLFLITISTAMAGKVKINGTAPGVKDGEKVTLYEVFGPEAKSVTVTEVKNEEFQFKFEPASRGLFRIGTSIENSDLLVVGDDNLDVRVSDKNFKEIKVEDSKDNELLNKLEAFNQDYIRQVQALQADAERARSLNSKNPAKAQSLFQSTKLKYDSVMRSRTTTYSEISDNNPGTFTGKICEFYLYTDTVGKSGFFLDKHVKDPELQRSEAFVVVASTYLNRFYQRQPAQVLVGAANQITNEYPEGSRERELMFLSFIHALATTANPKMAAQFAKRYKNEYPDSKLQQSISRKLPSLPLGVGDEAPDIVL